MSLDGEFTVLEVMLHDIFLMKSRML